MKKALLIVSLCLNPCFLLLSEDFRDKALKEMKITQSIEGLPELSNEEQTHIQKMVAKADNLEQVKFIVRQAKELSYAKAYAPEKYAEFKPKILSTKDPGDLLHIRQEINKHFAASR